MEMDSSIMISDLINDISINKSQLKERPNKQSQPKANTIKESNDVISNPENSDAKSSKEDKEESNVNSAKNDFSATNGANDEKPSVANKKSQINIHDVVSIWKDFVLNINNQRPSIGATLDHAKPTEINNNKLTITVSGLPEFSVKNLNHNNEFIEKSLNEQLKQSVKLSFIWDSDATDNNPISSQPSETIADTVNSDKVVEKIIEEFDGEILR